jgi:hypothetical protein
LERAKVFHFAFLAHTRSAFLNSRPLCLIFQSFLDANFRCFWNPSLLEAMRQLQYQGYVAPGVLLVSADPCALEIIRSAWGRKTLQAPSNHMITIVGE